jgi:hypothetical protein
MPWSLQDWTNAAQVLASLATIVGIPIALCTYRSSKNSDDLQKTMQLFDKINDYWDKMHSLENSDNKLWDFYFTQVMTYYELSCFVINRNLIGKIASEFLIDHIIEIWSTLASDPRFSEKIEALASAPKPSTKYENLQIKVVESRPVYLYSGKEKGMNRQK